jgi:serine/threonine protein kinase
MSIFSESFFREVSPEQGEKIKEEVQAKALELMEQQYKNREHVGKGKAAEVWAGDIRSFKQKIVAKTNYKTDISVNDLKQEFILQNKFIEAGGRGATPVMFVDDPKEKDQFSGQGVLVMKRIQGETLTEFMMSMAKNNQKFSINDVRRLQADIKQQIDIAHRANIYHRDLHLKNLMINEKGEVCVIDFGDAVDTTGVSDEEEIYTAEAWRGGKMVRIKFPHDEQALRDFASELQERKLVNKG